jgi:type II secretory pathway component GspD/PulD (secretin)
VLKGTTTIRAPVALTNDELWHLTNQLLAARGFTTVIRPGLTTYSAVQLTSASSMARIDTGDSPRFAPGFQKVMLPVHNREASRVAESLRPLVTATTGSVTAIPEASSVLVADLDPKIAEVREILPRLDSPVESSVMTMSVRRITPDAQPLHHGVTD